MTSLFIATPPRSKRLLLQYVTYGDRTGNLSDSLETSSRYGRPGGGEKTEDEQP